MYLLLVLSLWRSLTSTDGNYNIVGVTELLRWEVGVRGQVREVPKPEGSHSNGPVCLYSALPVSPQRITPVQTFLPGDAMELDYP